MGHKRERCPCCNSIIDGSGFREGVRLPATQLRIFDIVKSSGVDGLSCSAICERLSLNRHNVKAQIWNLNENLAMIGWRIRAGQGITRYRLERRPHGKDV